METPKVLSNLTTSLYRIDVPKIGNGTKLSFSDSFKTVGSHPTTKSILKQADSSRKNLISAGKSCQKNVDAANEYTPLIHQILTSVKVQPENAKLDQKLIFEWVSGIETTNNKVYKSEAIIFDLVMTIATEGIAVAGLACDECLNGDFQKASRYYKQAAGIMKFLAEKQLPDWYNKMSSSSSGKDLPAEASPHVCEALTILFLAYAQMMATAHCLDKTDNPSWPLLAKLSLGIAEQLKMFDSTLRSKASLKRSLFDSKLFTVVTFQIETQYALSLYYQARSKWENDREYGIAISMLYACKDKMKMRETPTSKGLPEEIFKKGSSLASFANDIHEMKSHVQELLTSWEKDNNKIYHDRVPLEIPDDKKLSEGTHITKADEYNLDPTDPFLIAIPGSNSTQVDDDHALALKLQAEEEKQN
jgi:hypothetical protein